MNGNALRAAMGEMMAHEMEQCQLADGVEYYMNPAPNAPDSLKAHMERCSFCRACVQESMSEIRRLRVAVERTATPAPGGGGREK